jgi:hypothetical protein
MNLIPTDPNQPPRRGIKFYQYRGFYAAPPLLKKEGIFNLLIINLIAVYQETISTKEHKG